MCKEKNAKFCSVASLLLLLCFFLKLARDWYVYRTTLNSAPFYLWVLVDAVYFLLPAACIFPAGKLVRARKNKESQKHDTDPIR